MHAHRDLQFREAQIKLSVVASDIFGVSGRDMMAALIAGERDPRVLAQMARSRMRTKIPQLQEAFVGYFTDHHGFLLTKMLARIDALSSDTPTSTSRSRPRSPLSLTRWLAWMRSPGSVPPRQR